MLMTIEVKCLLKLSQKQLERLRWDMIGVVTHINLLVQAGYMFQECILVLFPSDMRKAGLGSQILVKVSGLEDRGLCTLGVRIELAEKLGQVVEKMVPTAKISCEVHPVYTAHINDRDIVRWQNAQFGKY